jgi:hypothetical protein
MLPQGLRETAFVLCEQVTLGTEATCSLKGSVIVLSTTSGPDQAIPLSGCLINPGLTLDRCRVDLGMAYVGAPLVHTLTMSNLTQLPTSFRWNPSTQGTEGRLEVVVEPLEGEVGPGMHGKFNQVCVCVCV